eukprot:138161_1
MAFAPPQQQQQQPVQYGGQGAVLSEQLEIFISCRNLPKMDFNSPSDPFVVISQKNEKNNQLYELCKTEVIQDNNDPEFSKQIKIEYKFEEVQMIQLDVYDADSPNLTKLSDHDYIGHCAFVLGDLVTANGSKLAMKLKDKKSKPVMARKAPSICIVRSEEVQQDNDEFVIQFQATGLPKMTWMNKSNPFLQIYRKAPDGEWMSVMRTTTIKKTCSPKWGKITIGMQRLCNGDYSRPILIRCFHDKDSAAPEEIGYCETSVQELLDIQDIVLKHPTKPGKHHGSLVFPYRDIVKRYGFLEYIMGGMEIQLMIAVDFTGSNGDPRDNKSLHYIGPPKYESPYMRAIRSVGRVLEAYDSDGMIASYGFGANTNPFGQKNISHCFNLSMTNANEVPGIEGVLQAYTTCLNKIQLYGPTYFHEIIQTAASAAMSMPNNENEQSYVVLLILTDGIINDMGKTIDAVVGATELPLSIVIVGVGNADFSAMDKLDADDEPLRASNGNMMKRDIVQFVPFNKFINTHIAGLAKEVLEEVPDQITSFMTMKKLHPLRKNKAHLAKQPTMNNIYDGPSTLVRTQTQKNVNVNAYPQIQQQPQAQPVNPHYGQPQVVYVQQGGAPTVYAQQTVVQQQAYNPNVGGPSAPDI